MDELAQFDMDVESLARQQRLGAKPPLPAEFSIEAVIDDAETKKQGKPVYRDEERITIHVSPTQKLQRSVTDEYRRIYAAQYQAWKESTYVDNIVEGFPLAQWAMIPGKAVVKQFAGYGIKTVEQLAAATDATVQAVGPFLSLRQHARDWVASAEKQAPVAKLRAENEALATRVKTLEDMLGQATRQLEAARGNGGVLPPGPVEDPRIAAMQQQIASLAAALAPKDEAPSNGTPKRRGRPPGSKNKPKDTEA